MTRGQRTYYVAPRKVKEEREVVEDEEEEERMAREGMAQMSTAFPSQVCTTSKCAKCLQGGQDRDRKRCTTRGCQCSCPRFVHLPTHRQLEQTGQRSSHTNNSKVSMSSAEGDSITSTATSDDTSSVDCSSDNGETEGKITKTISLQAGSLGAGQLVIALQHSLHLLLEWTKLDNWGQLGKGKD
ncbi:hypothetical protein AZE42_05661 [Rhizopogon vesiculosus]|uniref:Uncharacterized protein n=1 Tax=Rhizopogon vesiculosus TaxID=180088 RepID=A0A1J8RCT9_9AGAM|nr:hypothetical protein AZE42_05661 [Rhizopogon vesiculosus]